MLWSFLNPSLLWGLPLISIPVLIHLFNRHRAVNHPFGAMEFILRSMKKSPKRLQLKALVLMLLRCFAVLFILLALAGLQRGEKTLVAPAKSQSKSVIVLLDASASMRWRDSTDRRLFDVAQTEAEKFVLQLRDADEVAVIVFDEKIQASDGSLRVGKSASTKLIRSAQPGYLGTEISVGIRAALRYLEEATHNQREIHLFTDLCAHGWQRSEMPSLEKLNVRLVLHDVQREDYPANLAIHQLKIQRDPSALGTFHFAVQVSNNGPGKVSDLPIILSVGKKEIARSFRNLMSGENINVAMTYRIPAEQLSQSENEKIILGKALVRADALPIDDQVYFQLQQRSVVHLLLIDGDPQPNHFFSETFYLAKALTTQSGENAQILSTQITLDEFQPLHLDEKDVVVLTNVRSLTLDRLEALRRFVAQGGGLLIAAGDQVDVDHYNQLFGDLLPAKLRDLRNEEFGISFESLSSEYNQNPIFRSFSEKDRSLFALSKFHRYFVVESKLGDKTEILLRLVSGAPILLGKNYRKGKVALWTSSMDRSWNDFPIQTTFLPFIHSLSFYLSGGNKETQIFEGITGHTVELIVEENIEKVVIQGPQGEIWQEIPERKEDGRRVVEFKEAYSPGHYELQFKASERLVVRKGSLFIHVPLEESQLVKISQKDLYRMIPEEVLELDSLGKGDGPLLVGAAQKTSLTSYVPFLFLSLVGFLFIEALVTSL